MSTLTLGTIDTLTALQAQIGAANDAQGFHEHSKALLTQQRDLEAAGYEELGPLREFNAANLRHYIMAKLGLIVTEVAEGIEEIRKGRAATETYYSGGIGFGLDHGADDDLQPDERFDANGAQRKPEGLPSELADVVIRAFDLAHEVGIDLAASIDEKLTYNATRARLHGKKL